MFKFFKNKDHIVEDNKLLSNTASLLIHAAKIDEDYTNEEKELIEKTLIKLGAKKSEINKIMNVAEINEANSNQMLEFTREIKNANEEFKIQIVETLWNIIYSDKKSDIYESNLMRRLTGLLYLDNKIVGDIQEKIKKNLTK